jgi:hypothetical protein
VALRSRRPNRRADALDAEPADPSDEVGAVDAIAVVDQVLGVLAPGRGLDHLAPHPGGDRVGGHVEVKQTTPIVADQEEDVEGLEGQGLEQAAELARGGGSGGRFAPDLKGAILGRVTSPRPQGPPPHAAHLSPNDGRIEALVSIVGLALLIFGLIEIDLRDQLGSHQAMPGLLPDGRSARPTGRNIFSAFQSLGLTYTSHGIRLDRLTATQRRILSLLRIPFPGWSNTPSPDPSHCVRKTGLTARFHGSNPCSGARIRTWWG